MDQDGGSRAFEEDFPRGGCSMHVEKCGRWLFRRGGELEIPFILAVLMLLRPRYPLGSHWFDEFTDIIGYLVMLGGVWIRVWAIGYRKAGISQRRGREIKSSELLTDGLYAYVRNPLYLGNLVIALGLTVIFSNPWLVLVLLAYLIYYNLIIRAEEDHLTRQFGETCLAYKRRTPRLLPAIRKEERNRPARRFDWNEVVRKEKDLFLAATLAPIAIEIYEDILHEGWVQFHTHDLGEVVVFLVASALAALLWTLVRQQKKRRLI